jgi:hypothetical protein
MPTAVERLFDSFLKLAGFDNNRHQQAELNEGFLKIDGDLLKLSSASPDTFLKVEHDRSLKLDFDVIGDAFIKLGRSFGQIASAGAVIDEFVLKLTGMTNAFPGVATTAAVVGGPPNPQADFLKLDGALKISAADLKTLGADFLKLDTSPNLAAFQHKLMGVSGDFHKLGGDMADNSAAFLKLGSDFLKLGDVANPSPLDLAYKELGGELQTVGSRFDALASDFHKLGQDLQGNGGTGGVGAAAAVSGPGMIGADFMTLSQDFHKLDTALDRLGDGAAAVVNDLFRQGGGGLA